MAINNPPTDPNAIKAIRVTQTNQLAAVLPTLSVGDVLRFAVRQNPAQGPGLIYLQGNLIQAELPQTLKVGDRVQAQITEADKQVTLRVLDRVPRSERAENPLSNKIASQLKLQIRELFQANLKGIETVKVSVEQQSPAIKQLLQALPNAADFKDVAKLTQQLNALTEGQTGAQLRAVLQNLKTEVARSGASVSQAAVSQTQNAQISPQSQVLPQQLASQPATSAASSRTQQGAQVSAAALSYGERTLTILSQQLQTLQERFTLQPDLVKARIGTLEKLMSQELTELKNFTARERSVLFSAQSSLRALAGQATPSLELLQQLSQQLESSELVSQAELARQSSSNRNNTAQVIPRLEQFITGMEFLNRMNPAMQAMGEPALILFPFILHGLMHHSEIVIDRGARRNPKGEEADENGGSSKGPNGKTYQRVQLSVPLPNLGEVNVDLAHKEKEILVRLTVADEEASQFLAAELEHLAVTLEKLGFSDTELTASNGASSPITPEWVEMLQEGRTVLA